MARRLPARIVDLVNRPWVQAVPHLQDIINAILDWLNDSWGGVQSTTKIVKEFVVNNPDSTFDLADGVKNHVAKFNEGGVIGVSLPMTTADTAGVADSSDFGTTNFLKVKGTITPTADVGVFGVLENITGSPGPRSQTAHGIFLEAGFAGPSYTVALESHNRTAGTTTNFITQGDDGIFGTAFGTATGSKVGVFGSSGEGNINIGTAGQANTPKDSATNVGVFGIGLNTGTTPIQIGGYFGLQANTVPTFTSAALVGDNGTTTSPIAIFRNNGVMQVKIGDGVPADYSQNLLEVEGELPASPSTDVTGVTFEVGSAGSAAHAQIAASSHLGGGYTGNQLTAGLVGSNDAGGTGTSVDADTANYGGYFLARGSTTGTNAGVLGHAAGGNKNIGVFGRTVIAKNNATNVGGMFLGKNTGSSAIHVGAFIGLNGGTPTFESCALLVDNENSTDPIAIFKNGAVAQVKIGDGVPNNNSQHFLEVVGTLPSSPSVAPVGVVVDITSAGSAGFNQYGIIASLLAGYTGASSTFVLQAQNSAAGSTNIGIRGQATGAGTNNKGGYFTVSGGTLSNVGVHAQTEALNSTASAIGIFATAINAGTGAAVPGYFGSEGTNFGAASDSGIIVDNGTTNHPIARFRDTSADVVRIADGGALELSTISSIATNGSIQIGGTDVVTPGTSTWAGAERASGQTDGSGGELIVAAGRGTGTGNGGDLRLQIAPPAGSSGTSQNTLHTGLWLRGESGAFILGNINSTAPSAGFSSVIAAHAATGKTDASGGFLTLASGVGTGTGNGGSFTIAVAPPGTSSGTTQNAHKNVMSVGGNDLNIGIGGFAGGETLGSAGAVNITGINRPTTLSDVTAGHMNVGGGQGNGTGAGGSVFIRIAPASASSGSSRNAYQNIGTFGGSSGEVNLGGININGAISLPSSYAASNVAAGITDGSAASGSVTIRGGAGTGTGAEGNAIIQLAPPAASTGTTQNAFRDVERWDVSSVADPQSTDITMSGNNAGTMVRKSFSELLTLNTGSTTTDTTANLLPANAIILAVNTRVTTTITTATTFSVGDPTTAARFSASAGGLTAGSTRVGLQHQQGSVTTDAAGPVQTTAAKVRITTDANPGAGVIRIQVWALVFTAPTS